MPTPDEPRETGPLGSDLAAPGDPDSQGGSGDSPDEVAGPSFPPAGSEPAAGADDG